MFTITNYNSKFKTYKLQLSRTSTSIMSLIKTKAALALKNAESNFQFVKFEAHKPKKKLEESNTARNPKLEQPKSSKKDPVLKKIRHEVVKFGMSGFDTTKKEEAKIALAVSLGAKPPKRPYVNYKELMQKRKEQREKEKEDRRQMISKSVMQTVDKKKHKGLKKKNGVGNFLENYGKVQKKDLKKKEEKGPKKKKKNLKI